MLGFACEFVSRHLEARLDVVHFRDDVHHYYYQQDYGRFRRGQKLTLS